MRILKFNLNTPYPAQIAGSDELWDPIWGLKVKLTEIKLHLLHSFELRRLQFIHHGGCSYINTQNNTTRLQHTIGVFSLISKFCPDWFELRVAALLHDVGHLPFSHALEQVLGIDHHKLTEELLYSGEISNLLLRYGFNISEILDLINGNKISPLRNKSNKLNLDHLDSFVRSGILTGTLTTSPQSLLSKLELKDHFIATDTVTAEELKKLIVSEAYFHCSAANIGPNAVLNKLVGELIDHKIISYDTIYDKTDAWIENYLMECEVTSNESKRLFYRPHEIIVTNDKTKAPNTAYIYKVNKLYLSEPVIADGTSMNSMDDFKNIPNLLGDYYVYWNN